MHTTHHGKSRLTILIAVAILVVIGTGVTLRLIHSHQFPPELRGFAVAPKPIGKVQLVDKNGQTLLDNYFKGKWTLVFFGYTNCPDVCPSTLMQIKELYKTIKKEPDSRQYQFLFISVDPARDNVPRLKSFVEYFDKDFDAASGEIGHIKTFEKVFGAFHHYAKKSKDDMHYAVAHSAEVYIVSPREQFVGKFLPPINVNKLMVKLSKLNAYVHGQGGRA
jgi:protein SCO1